MCKHAAPILLGIGLTISPLALCAGWLWLRWLELAARMPAVADAIRVSVFLLPVLAALALLPLAGLALYNRTRWAAVQADKTIALVRAQQQLTSLTHLTYHGSRPQPAAPAIEAPALTPALANVPSFSGLLDTGSVGRNRRELLLGFSEATSSPITGSWLDLYSTAIGGLPGTGKTTTQRFLACQTALAGARFLVIDPHAGAADDSLAATLAPLGSCFLAEPASDDKTILNIARQAAEIGQRRITGADQDATPIILWIDELTALLGRSSVGDKLAELLERIAQEYRKRGLFICASGQIWTASRTTSELRDSFASVVCHRMKRNQARLLLPTDEAQQVERLGTGHAVLWRTSGLTETIVIPQTTADDVTRVGQLLSQPTAPTKQPLPFGFRPSMAEGAKKGAPEGAINIAPSTASESAGSASPEAARVLALIRGGKSISEVVRELWGVSAGREYQRRAAEVLSIIREALR